METNTPVKTDFLFWLKPPYKITYAIKPIVIYEL